MKAMILAAGRGRRLRPLTDKLPKPLLPVAGKPLIYYHLDKLARAGVTEVVINCAWQAAKLRQLVGDGSAWQLKVHWSAEPEGGLETAGGIIQALPMLGPEPFWVVNGDIFTRYSFSRLPRQLSDSLAHLVLVPNPPQHQAGDFQLAAGGRVTRPEAGESLTFAGISTLSPQLFNGFEPGFRPLRPVLEQAIDQGKVQGEKFAGTWHDIGTPERWRALNQTQLVGL